MTETTLTCAPPGQPESRIVIRVGARADCASLTGPNRYCLFDERVAELFADAISPVIPGRSVPAGEGTKCFAELERITRALAAAEIDRGGELIVVGGGTIGDVGGFAAASYLRGIRFVQVPTTLLAMVDSSVGGKTAVNIPEGKNLVGAFWPPELVLIDPEFLSTLPESDFRSGLGEVLKAAIGLDAELFELCSTETGSIQSRDPDAMARVLVHSLTAKIRLVEADFREGGQRRLLNLGHTVGHAIEAASGFSIPHGIAVARGIHFALDLAEREGAMVVADANQARQLLNRFGFEASPLPDRSTLEPFLRRDKKRAGTTVRFVLPTAIGKSETRAIAVEDLIAALPAS